MEWTLRIDGRDLRLRETPDGADALRLELDGDSTLVGWERLDANRWRILIDGVPRLLHVARTEGGVWVWIDGRARFVANADDERRRRRGKAESSGPGIVTPPMPGVVVRLAVAVGDAVAKGQCLVVVSAMKMESELAAPYAGTVTAIRTAQGAKVMPGEVLVEIAPTPKENEHA